MTITSALRALVPGVLVPALMGHAGGWAVITIDDLPDYAIAGKPLTLTYTVRQHGRNLLSDLRGSIEASTGRQSTTGSVTSGAPGRYTARITLPDTGNWSITVRSGFGPSDVTLMPLTAVRVGGRLTTTVSETDRGRRLFIAKGCVTCHEQIDVGPRLDGKRFDVAYISRFLANPPDTASRRGQSPMPNLGLQPTEIAALVGYLNSDRRVSQRR